MANLRQKSKENFDGNDTIEHINSGSLQRIADATEKMALNHHKLISDRDWYKQISESRLLEINRLAKRVAAYKGVITKLKKSR